MSTALDVDIAALVGEMEAVPCDSGSHAEHHADEPASHYARAICVCGFNEVRAYCPTMVTNVILNRPVRCSDCNDIRPAHETITILGPVGSSK